MYCFAWKPGRTLSEQASALSGVVWWILSIIVISTAPSQLHIYIYIPALPFSKTPRCFYLLPLECELKKAASVVSSLYICFPQSQCVCLCLTLSLSPAPNSRDKSKLELRPFPAAAVLSSPPPPPSWCLASILEREVLLWTRGFDMVMDVEGRVREEWGRGIEFLWVLLQLGRLFFIVKEMFCSNASHTNSPPPPTLTFPHLFNINFMRVKCKICLLISLETN